MSGSEAKYDALAEGFSEREYADPAAYSASRARVIVSVGPPLPPGATVVDLCCGDGIMADPLGAHGLRYTGVDSSTQMVQVARRSHPGLPFVIDRAEDFRPATPVDATICLRSFYQPVDRVAFFRGIAEYTKVKFVFDFRQPAHPVETVERDLRLAGFGRIVMRPFFVPQRRSVPGLAAGALEAAERTGRLGLFLSRYAGRVFCSASV